LLDAQTKADFPAIPKSIAASYMVTRDYR
jgi:hypothetical protein